MAPDGATAAEKSPGVKVPKFPAKKRPQKPIDDVCRLCDTNFTDKHHMDHMPLPKFNDVSDQFQLVMHVSENGSERTSESCKTKSGAFSGVLSHCFGPTTVVKSDLMHL